MTTTTTQAEQRLPGLIARRDAGFVPSVIPAPESVSGVDYGIGYFADGSAITYCEREGCYRLWCGISRDQRDDLAHGVAVCQRLSLEDRVREIRAGKYLPDRFGNYTIRGCVWSPEGAFLGIA